MKQDIKSMLLPEIEAQIVEMGEPGFRAKQVFTWIHQKKAVSFSEMTNLSKALQQRLAERYIIPTLLIRKKLVSQIDGTIKYLFELPDGECIESVFMRYKHGNSLCLSTQVGCKMGCNFCASTIAGFVRNLSPAEILDQILSAERDTGEKVNSIVLMGIGEPLDNFENVIRFLALLSDENGMNMSHRHVSLSTCGLVDKIYELADLHLQLTLSISLHAPNDEIRSRTMPVNRRYPVDELLKACRDYTKITKRRISFEYALIDGVNDSDRCAALLAAKLKGMLCHVNLIPINEVKERSYKKSSIEHIKRFSAILENASIPVTVRRKLGADINAACGQLRRDDGGKGEIPCHESQGGT